MLRIISNAREMKNYQLHNIYCESNLKTFEVHVIKCSSERICAPIYLPSLLSCEGSKIKNKKYNRKFLLLYLSFIFFANINSWKIYAIFFFFFFTVKIKLMCIQLTLNFKLVIDLNRIYINMTEKTGTKNNFSNKILFLMKWNSCTSLTIILFIHVTYILTIGIYTKFIR